MDRFDEKAEAMAVLLKDRNYDSESAAVNFAKEMIAAALRESAAEAYEDAAKIRCMDCYSGDGLEQSKIPFVYKHGAFPCVASALHAKASALRNPSSGGEGE